MKKIVFVAALMASVMGLKAQNCEQLMLPYFRGDADAMAAYPQEKLEWRCAFARAAFYVSDTVLAGVDVYPITEVQSYADGTNLPPDFVVDLSTLSFYAYTFKEVQLRYPKCNVTIAFSTPASEHQYLILRSINDMFAKAEELYNKEREL